MIKFIQRPAFAFTFLFIATLACASLDVNAVERVFPYPNDSHPDLHLNQNEVSCWMDSNKKDFNVPWLICSGELSRMLSLYAKIPSSHKLNFRPALKECQLNRVISKQKRHYFVFGCSVNLNDVQQELTAEYHLQPYWFSNK